MLHVFFEFSILGTTTRTVEWDSSDTGNGNNMVQLLFTRFCCCCWTQGNFLSFNTTVILLSSYTRTICAEPKLLSCICCTLALLLQKYAFVNTLSMLFWARLHQKLNISLHTAIDVDVLLNPFVYVVRVCYCYYLL